MSAYKVDSLSGVALEYAAALAFKKRGLVDFDLKDHHGFFKVHDISDNVLLDASEVRMHQMMANTIYDLKIKMTPGSKSVNGELIEFWTAGKFNSDVEITGKTFIEAGLKAIVSKVIGDQIHISEDIAAKIFPNSVDKTLYHVTTKKNLSYASGRGFLAKGSNWLESEEDVAEVMHGIREAFSTLGDDYLPVVIVSNASHMFDEMIHPFNVKSEMPHDLLTDDQVADNDSKKKAFEATDKTWHDSLITFGSVVYSGSLPIDCIRIIPDFNDNNDMKPKMRNSI